MEMCPVQVCRKVWGSRVLMNKILQYDSISHTTLCSMIRRIYIEFSIQILHQQQKRIKNVYFSITFCCDLTSSISTLLCEP